MGKHIYIIETKLVTGNASISSDRVANSDIRKKDLKETLLKNENLFMYITKKKN